MFFSIYQFTKTPFEKVNAVAVVWHHCNDNCRLKGNDPGHRAYNKTIGLNYHTKNPFILEALKILIFKYLLKDVECF